ncbi:hypothetical protein QR680_000262 [Steinernema hermaphroditum]|uniref:AMOP domain-containing protein n=1 Tax=Steinernema hermaphroditum TaxID=289476 RepID=A0AA39GUV8_9BILA|nr:hypothetical protein QR680_000262 [Steinernema hermaphroditum]
MNWAISLIVPLVVWLLPSAHAQANFNPLNQNDPLPVVNDPYQVPLHIGEGLVEYGRAAGDKEITNNQRASGMTIPLYMNFPFFQGRYNYTMISTSGFISFAYFTDNEHTPRIGKETDWPREADPALIAPYLCKQRIAEQLGDWSRIYYRLEMRSGLASASRRQSPEIRKPCPGKQDHVQCNYRSDLFLNRMMRHLQDGVAGASTFRADAALVVTWENMQTTLGGNHQTSTYQLVWLTDARGMQSYTMINYNKLGYDAADVQGNTRMGKCQAVFNGGNHTGIVQVDLNEITKERPSSLADRSSVPHIVRGRYFHRVDDIVRPAGCSNKTGGTFPLLIYPNIVSMLGEAKVDVNGLCLNPNLNYVLMIESRMTAPCEVLNPSIARCSLPKILDWGTKTVFLQPQSGLGHDEKAFVGYIYFVPPTIDPMRLDIGDIHSWFRNPVEDDKMLVWYPRNFTVPTKINQIHDVNNPSLYNQQLGLYVIGYKEGKDEQIKKFKPEHRVLARLTTFQNRGDEIYRWDPIRERLPISQVDQWYLTDYERERLLYTFRFGYFKLAPLPINDQSTAHYLEMNELPTGLVSSPISLHWLWTIDNKRLNGKQEDHHAKVDFVKQKAREMCHEWYDEDGALDNFIRDVESNASCPCREDQAKIDIGRFMPHPRCSQLFRDVTCTENLGSRNCYMSAQNVQGSIHQNGKLNVYDTHSGQVCCYDESGYLMQSSYQPIIKIDDTTPYSPGFPMRAFEFGTPPYQGMFEVPGFSAFHHDMMPYYLCCKFTDARCQMFYWRRPSSSCQAYTPPSVGTVMGPGIFTTLNNEKFVFNDPGVYTLLHSHRSYSANTPEVRIQVRMERFPDRSVDFGSVNIAQEDLVVPSNVTVVTGIVLESGDSDRVHVVLRKDTRRFRYRTSVLVGNVVRYFDNMKIQRFRGVTIYVNNVHRGQAETYVVLDNAQIGVRIRESYSADMDRYNTYMESFGLLDVELSLPPRYRVKYDSENMGTSSFGDYPRVEGLLRPNPDNLINVEDQPLRWSDVNNEGFRQMLMKYRIKGEEEMNIGQQSRQNEMVDMFVSQSDHDAVFEVFVDSELKLPVYKSASKYHLHPNQFVPQTETQIKQFAQMCRGDRQMGYDPDSYFYPDKIMKRCPRDEMTVEADCGDSIACKFTALLLQALPLGILTNQQLYSFGEYRYEAMRKYNSCGAINFEYPEYMIKGPSSAAPAYLEGDIVSLSCFQTHILLGDSDYKCSRVPIGSGADYRMQWTHGSQPFCRDRVQDNVYTWLQWTAIVLAVLALLIILFAVCYSVGHAKRQNSKPPSERANPSSGDGSSLRNAAGGDVNKPLLLNSMEMTPRSSYTPYRRPERSEEPSFDSLDKPPVRTSSQPYIFSQPPTNFSTPQPRRHDRDRSGSRGATPLGLTTGVSIDSNHPPSTPIVSTALVGNISFLSHSEQNMMRKLVLALFVVSAISAYPQGNEEGPSGQESNRRRQYIQPLPGAAQGPLVAAAPVVDAAPVVAAPAVPVVAAPAVVAAPLGQCPGGPSLPVECDPKRPWPQCPPQSYCYATNSVDIGPYFCCPIWSTYGAAWRPATPFYNYVPPMPANWPDVVKVTANWPAAAVGLPVMTPIRKSKKQQNFNNDETTEEQQLIDSSMKGWLSRQASQ